MARIFNILLGGWLSLSGLAAHTSPVRLPAENGLKAEYFNGMEFEDKVYTRYEQRIDFSLLGESPAPNVHPEDFSVRWTGQLLAHASGVYTFMVRADDGVRIWLNNQLILDEWHLQQETFYQRKVLLKGEQFYNLKVEYYNHELHAVLQLYWLEPPTEAIPNPTKTIIPETSFFRTKPPARPTSAPAASPSVRPSLVTTTEKKPTKAVKKPVRQLTRKEPETKPEEPKPVEKPRLGEAFVLKNVEFEQSKYVLLPESYPELEKLAETLRKFPELKISLEGHTDNWGDPRLNQALSEYRAQVVAVYLIRKGIEENRLEFRGFGGSRPIADNSKEEERAKNRRVEFRVRE
jgi:outer membrane protein OmpA-like peptidoglycan-associated protein